MLLAEVKVLEESEAQEGMGEGGGINIENERISKERLILLVDMGDTLVCGTVSTR